MSTFYEHMHLYKCQIDIRSLYVIKMLIFMKVTAGHGLILYVCDIYM